MMIENLTLEGYTHTEEEGIRFRASNEKAETFYFYFADFMDLLLTGEVKEGKIKGKFDFVKYGEKLGLRMVK